MWKPSHRALKFFFTAFALIALSACGGSSGGGGGGGDVAQTPPIVVCRASCPDGTASDYTAPPSEPIPGEFMSWEGDNDAIDTDGAAGAQRTDEYKNDGGGADRIGAAYAYARGYNGRGHYRLNDGGPY